MSKSVLIGRTQEEVDKKETCLKLGDDFLNSLYIGMKKQKKMYPLLWRLVKDFYGHVFFSISEIKNLSQEIKLFLSTSPSTHDDYIVWLMILHVLCDEAADKNMALFFDAD